MYFSLSVYYLVNYLVEYCAARNGLPQRPVTSVYSVRRKNTPGLLVWIALILYQYETHLNRNRQLELNFKASILGYHAATFRCELTW